MKWLLLWLVLHAPVPHRLVCIDFYSAGCHFSAQMERTTWRDREVRTWLAGHATCEKVDGDRQTALVARYQVDSFPTTLLILDGHEIERLIGFRTPRQFLHDTRAALAGHDSLSRDLARLKDHPGDWALHLQIADLYRFRNMNAKALAEYQECLEHAERSERSWRSVLNGLQALAARDAPTQRWMEERRDAVEQQLYHKPQEDDAMLLGLLNECLGQPEASLRALDRLKVSPALSWLCFPELLRQKRYQQACMCREAMQRELHRRHEQLNAVALEGPSPTLNRALQIVLTGDADWYEALLGASQSIEASQLRDEILTLAPTTPTFRLLIKHALRTGKTTEAALLGDRARALLNPQDVAGIQRTLQTIEP